MHSDGVCCVCVGRHDPEKYGRNGPNQNQAENFGIITVAAIVSTASVALVVLTGSSLVSSGLVGVQAIGSSLTT